MIKPGAIFVPVLLLAGICVLVWQRLEQDRLRLQNQELHRQIQELTAENIRLSDSFTPASAVQGAATDWLKELLRLRNEAATWRRQSNAIASLQEENSRLRAISTAGPLAEPKEAADEDPLIEQQKQTGMAKMTDARTLALGFMLHAEDNQGKYPGTLDDLSPYWGRSGALTGTNEFDIAYQGARDAITNPASVILVRERQAWQLANGRWAKA